MNKKTIRDLDVTNQKVLMRVDFNVPLHEGKITDDTRLRGAVPSIEHLVQRGASVILCSHLGRPKGVATPELSLRPIAARLSELLAHPVQFVPQLVGAQATAAAAALAPGQILLLENTRFEPGETKNDPALAQQLAALADLFVNDAFGTAHRAHASNVGVAQHLPSAAGFLLEKEIEYLSNAIANPVRPFVAVLGGAKISDKIGVIRNLLDKADHILIGGGMANTFLIAQGYGVADSLVETEAVATAKELIDGEKIMLPIDLVLADAFSEDANTQTIDTGDVPVGWRILDIGPKSVARYAAFLRDAGTVVWNGPMGVFEFPTFAKGTFGLAKALAASEAISIVGGGDSVAAIHGAGLANRITHISTGGGASLAMLAGEVLPGVAALNDG